MFQKMANASHRLRKSISPHFGLLFSLSAVQLINMNLNEFVVVV